MQCAKGVRKLARVRRPELPVRAAGVKALFLLVAPGRRRWSRWSARSEARTYDLDRPEGRCRRVMGRGLVAGALCVTWVLDELVVGDNISDWVSPTTMWVRGRVNVPRPSSTNAGGHAGCGSWDGGIVPLVEQDRRQWDIELIAEGVAILQAALAEDQLGEYQAQAAIAALHADAPRFEDTDWVQIVEWYDELLRFADTPIIRLNRAVAVGEADGAPAGLAALAEVDENVPRRDAVSAHLHERNGDLELAARLYASAARNAPSLAERDHQTRQAARLNQLLNHER